MNARSRRPGLLGFAAGAVTALAGARLFAPRSRPRPAETRYGEQAGRGTPDRAAGAASVAAGYEVPDVAAGRVGLVMVIFMAAAMAGVALMAGLLSALHHRDAAREAGLTAVQRLQAPPPLPHLQADPVRELADLRAAQLARLHGYGWVDTETAHIPIARAMALVGGQSLDAQAAGR